MPRGDLSKIDRFGSGIKTAYFLFETCLRMDDHRSVMGFFPSLLFVELCLTGPDAVSDATDAFERTFDQMFDEVVLFSGATVHPISTFAQLARRSYRSGKFVIKKRKQKPTASRSRHFSSCIIPFKGPPIISIGG